MRKIRDMDLAELGRSARGISGLAALSLLILGAYAVTHPHRGDGGERAPGWPVTAFMMGVAVLAYAVGARMRRATGTPVERARKVITTHVRVIMFTWFPTFYGMLFVLTGPDRQPLIATAVGGAALIGQRMRAARYFRALESEAADAAFEAGEL